MNEHDKATKHRFDTFKKLARAVVALEDVSRDKSYLGLSQDEQVQISKAYRELDSILAKLEESGIESEALRLGYDFT